MKAFTSLAGVAAPLPLGNVDTDQILPAPFMKTVSRRGLGQHLFASLRADPGFILNRPPWDAASILIAHENFGCGSSREHAPWALADFGIRCIIAPSFADIFYGNCFKNGMLPVTLRRAAVDRLMALAREPTTVRMTVDLESCRIMTADGAAIPFDLDPRRRRDLMGAIDDIARTLAYADAIAAFEAARVARGGALPPISQAAIDAA